MKNKGFTVVELVIAVAVTAILAAVTVPVLSDVIESANISADTQTVRNMNVILTAESSNAPAPTDPAQVIALLKKNGVNNFIPQNEFYTFYWLKNENVIILADKGDHPVYPEEFSGKTYTDGNWFDLEKAEALPPPTRPESSDDALEPQTFTVTVSQSGSSVTIPFVIPTTVKEGDEFHLELTIPSQMQDRYLIEKLTAIMTDGETRHKFVARSKLGEITGQDSPFARDETAIIDIPCVTGDISINIAIREYTIITLKGDHFREGKTEFRVLEYEKSNTLYIDDFIIQELILEEGYKITSAKGTQNGRDLGKLYDPKKNCIRSKTVFLNSDIEIELQVEKIVYTVELVIMESGAEKGRVSQKVGFGQGSCSFDLKNILENRKIEVYQKAYTSESESIDEELRPGFDFNAETNTITLSDIKCDFKLTCFVKAEE